MSGGGGDGEKHAVGCLTGRKNASAVSESGGKNQSECARAKPYRVTESVGCFMGRIRSAAVDKLCGGSWVEGDGVVASTFRAHE